MTTYRRNNANRDAGFTLIEILVVIVIIGLLAGMTTTVLVSARQAARSSVVASQMAQLSMALDDYKNKYGEYPPDFSDQVAVERHLKKRWPRYNATYADFLADIEEGCRIASSSDPVAYLADGSCAGEHVWRVAEAPYLASLVFWLGGLPDEDGKPSGFYANPKAPLGVAAGVPISRISKAIREEPTYAFDLKNVGAYLIGAGTLSSGQNYVYPAEDEETWDGSIGAFVYIPAISQGDLPIVYFRPSSNVPYEGDLANNMPKALYLAEDSSASYVTCAMPYVRSIDASGVNDWFEAKRFQLVHPGVDGAFGPNENETAREGFPTLSGYDGTKEYVYTEDFDNVVNFATGGTLDTEFAE